MENNAAIIVAGGSGTRMGTEIHKQYLELKGKPILAYTAETFQNAGCIREIILVTGPGEEAYVRKEIVERYGLSKVCRIVAGGAERYESVYAGLQCCAGADYVFVQDAVRPFITQEILERGLETAKRYGSAVCGVPSKDTVKITDMDGVVSETPPRDRVWIIQTPQIFPYRSLREAYDRVITGKEGSLAGRMITDDAMIMENTGADVRMFMGDYRNIKITTPEDLQIAEALL